MTDKTELLPCPFCDSSETMDMQSDGNFWIQCAGCNCCTQVFEAEENSHEAWNTRAASAERPPCANSQVAAPAEDVRATTYDPAKENKDFEAWARTQSMVSLRLCDIGLYYDRQTGLAHDAWQHRAKFAEDVRAVVDEPLDPVHGDVLPPIGSMVQIQLGDGGWFDRTVTGYYVWPSHGLDKNVHRVFVRVKDGEGTPNARLLADIRKPESATPQ